MRHNLRPLLLPIPGFTLIEVAIAIAMFAIGVVGLLALIQGGFSHMRSAMDMTVASQIANQVAGEAGQDGFGGLLAQLDPNSREGRLPVRNFAQTGREVPADDEGRYYEVHTRCIYRDQLPMKDGRMDAGGVVMMTVEVTVPGEGRTAPLREDGLVDRTRVAGDAAGFPFIFGGFAP